MRNPEIVTEIKMKSTVGCDVAAGLGILKHNTNLVLSEARDNGEGGLALSSCVHRNPTAFEIFCTHEIHVSSNMV